MQLCFIVPSSLDGVLLRVFLRQWQVSTELSRAIKFRGGGYFADGVSILANRPVFAGQKISFDLPPELTDGVVPEEKFIPQIVYEDDFAIVLNKPAGIAVHPTLNYGNGTLANGYAALMKSRGESPVFRAVNRIDKDTSGLVLAAKNAYATPLLAASARKKYYAAVQGILPFGKGVIDAPLGRKGDSIIGRCVTPDGKPSRTEYDIVCHGVSKQISMAVCVPVTGRTHQIRVHFSSIGYPLAGDDLYGGERTHIARQALHCGEVTFQVLNYTKEKDCLFILPEQKTHTVCVKEEMPIDMQALFIEN